MIAGNSRQASRFGDPRVGRWLVSRAGPSLGAEAANQWRNDVAQQLAVTWNALQFA